MEELWELASESRSGSEPTEPRTPETMQQETPPNPGGRGGARDAGGGYLKGHPSSGDGAPFAPRMEL